MREERNVSAWVLGSLLTVLVLTRLARQLLDVHLPDAAVPTFFLAACLGLPTRALVQLLLAAAGIDLLQFALGASTACVSPGYPLLFVAYVTSWLGGRLACDWAIHLQALATFASTVLAFILTSGGYYLLSGKFSDPSLAEFVVRSEQYLPSYFANAMLYAGPGLLLNLLWNRVSRRSTT
jgi:hypothetical protein